MEVRWEHPNLDGMGDLGGLFFFFQAEDGIRDYKVTGVQTCALPICLILPAGIATNGAPSGALFDFGPVFSGAKPVLGVMPALVAGIHVFLFFNCSKQIGRASCRERV